MCIRIYFYDYCVVLTYIAYIACPMDMVWHGSWMFMGVHGSLILGFHGVSPLAHAIPWPWTAAAALELAVEIQASSRCPISIQNLSRLSQLPQQAWNMKKSRQCLNTSQAATWYKHIPKVIRKAHYITCQGLFKFNQLHQLTHQVLKLFKASACSTQDTWLVFQPLSTKRLHIQACYHWLHYELKLLAIFVNGDKKLIYSSWMNNFWFIT
jgi:hypothetical protein